MCFDILDISSLFPKRVIGQIQIYINNMIEILLVYQANISWKSLVYKCPQKRIDKELQYSMYRQVYDEIVLNENVHINHLRSIWSLVVFANH